MTHEQLRALYGATPLDHREIAIGEREVWSAYAESSDAKLPKRDMWFQQTFGVNPPTHVMFRAALLSHEPWSRPAWSLIEKFGIGRVYRICNDLKSDADRESVIRELVEDPSKVDGYKLERSGGRAEKVAKLVNQSPGVAHELRAKLRELVMPFVRQRLAELEEPALIEEIVGAFEIEVQTAFDDLLKRIKGGRSGGKSVIETKRRDVRRACEFLGLKLPARGGSIDMDQARRAHRKLSAQFHPDRTNGNEQLTAQYLEVQRAWETISSYTA